MQTRIDFGIVRYCIWSLRHALVHCSIFSSFSSKVLCKVGGSLYLAKSWIDGGKFDDIVAIGAMCDALIYAAAKKSTYLTGSTILGYPQLFNTVTIDPPSVLEVLNH